MLEMMKQAKEYEGSNLQKLLSKGKVETPNQEAAPSASQPDPTTIDDDIPF